MKLPIKFTIKQIGLLSLLWAGINLCAFAQTEEPQQNETSENISLPESASLSTDTVLNDSIPNDSTHSAIQQIKPVKKKEPLLYGMELGFDYLKLTSFAVDYEQKWEANIGLLLKKNFLITFEAGQGRLEPGGAYRNADYIINGNYGRIGLDYIFPFDPKNNLFFGARLGRSQYGDKGTYFIQNNLWEDFESSFERNNLTAYWTELTAGSESSLGKNFYMGFIFRFRIMLNHEKAEPFNIPVFAVPGFGRTMDRTIPAVNLYIKYRLPFKKQADPNLVP